MNVKFSREQADWLMKVTDQDTLQDAVNDFVRLMRLEGIEASDILTLVQIMMRRGVMPGKK